MATYLTYRNGNGSLDDLVKEAVTHFHKRYGRLPGALVVHKTLLDEAVKVIGKSVEVGGSGGCLAGEVWLRVEERRAKDGE